MLIILFWSRLTCGLEFGIFKTIVFKKLKLFQFNLNALGQLFIGVLSSTC